jgi:predicted phage terminase large subunit-like protein
MSSIKLSRLRFLDELADFADEAQQLVEADCDGFSVDPAASKQRRHDAWDDLRYFFYTYFPHYVKGDGESSVFHDYALDEIPAKILAGEILREVIAAPRGEAKSTIFAMAMLIWLVVTKRKKFIGLLMDSSDQAEMLLEAVKVEFENNPRLLMDFPEAMGKGPRWRIGLLITNNGIRIKSAGMDKKIRGWRHGAHRPDFMLMDDIENDDNVRKPEQRDKLQKKINKAVLKLGPPDGSMDTILYGTILMYDSVLSRYMDSPSWTSHRFQAIVNWPDAMDLWEKWEEVFLNEGKVSSDKFYKKNRKTMNQGAVVSWPSMRPLLMLMELRAEDSESFDTEYQNDPGNSEDAPFQDLVYWVHPCRDWVFYAACDPSLGKNNKRRDPSAILVGGYDRNHGILDIVEASIRRRVPDKIISDIIEFQKQYTCIVWAIESVQFQEFMRTELVKRSAAQHIPVPARAVIPITDKDLRIESIQPHCVNGLIRFSLKHKVLLRQLMHWPEADHDDGPDALEMLYKLAVSGAGGIPKILSSQRASAKRYRGH